MQEPKLHAKAVLIDDTLSMIGSFDVNHIEGDHTAEAAVLVYDRTVAASLEAAFGRAVAAWREITLEQRRRRSFIGRGAERLAYRLSRV